MPEPRRHAEGTTVPTEKSKADIERLLTNHGATGFMSAWVDKGGKMEAIIQFTLCERMLKYTVDRPEPEEFDKTSTSPRARKRNKDQRVQAAEAEYRRRWRALLLIIKAKLELVAGGDSNFDREFLADIMLPDGGTVGDLVLPKVNQAYADGKMPPLLGMGS